ncbi:MAG: DNA primase [Candidatus Shikimatogenerans bostrichidophilus]|nr:MAG: DNA primase [Candidatus Shikimatogenerans bostrichidophilus]
MNYKKIKKIINNLKIEKIIGNFIKIEKCGKNYRGFSPFNKEKIPSFIISPDKKIWKDFSSGRGGNLISFLIQYLKINYIDAVNYLLKKYYKNFIFFNNTKTIYINNILKLQEYAKVFFINKLNEKQNIKNYLINRGFNNLIIKKFSIGFAPPYNSLIKYFINKNIKINKNKIIDYGLFSFKKKKILDIFQNRIMFPIKNIYGYTIGFGGRNINNNLKYNKYLNSPNNIIYNKSKILYGIFEAKKYILKYNRCFITEGYTDVISLYQNGLKNVVSSSGTYINTYQINIIKKYTKNIILLYDGDEAGIKASIKSIDIFLQNNINIKFFIFPYNYDPNSFLFKKKKINKNKIQQYFKKKSLNFLEFKMKIFNKYFNDPFQKYILIKSIIKNIYNISNNIIKYIYLQEVEKIFNIKKEIIYKEINKFYIKNNKPKYLIFKDKKKYIYYNPILKIENIFIKKILNYKKYINKYLIINYKKKKIIININKILKNIIKEIKKNKIIFNNKENYIIIKNINKSLKKKKTLIRKEIKKKYDKKISNKIIYNFFKEIILKYKYYLILKKINLYIDNIKNNKNNNNLLQKIFFLTKQKNKIEQKLYFL